MPLLLCKLSQAESTCCFGAGQVIYHGPVEEAAGYFEALGFRCPERKGVADFLQEVTSEKVHIQNRTPGSTPPVDRLKDGNIFGASSISYTHSEISTLYL